MKRILDLCISVCGLFLLFPMLLFLAVLVRINLGTPIFFRQKRAGKDGIQFTLIKFRSMRDVCNENGELLDDSQRLTKLGKFLRRTSFDEIPELWNVLKGEMSLVGPRPLLVSYLPLYSKIQSRRHEIKPGITGWAQIHGRNAIDWERKLELDVWYVDNHNTLLDFEILLKTIGKVLVGEGVSAHGEAGGTTFKGSKTNKR